MIMYVGIKPPPKYIVKIKNRLKNRQAINSRLLSEKAIMQIAITESGVPTTVRRTVTFTELISSELRRIDR